jgi:succinate dehydrogenase/fumarate reductase flavoprotein subunit
MIASAVGGAYAYSVLDGKMAVSDAKKIIERVNVSDYDSTDSVTVQDYIDQANKDLETAKSRKEVYEIVDKFKEDVSKVMTRNEKELEAARKELEEARKNSAATDTTATDSSSQYDSDNEDSSDSKGGLFNNIFGNKDDDSSSENAADEDSDSTF